MRDYGRRTTEFFSVLNRDSLPLIDTFYDQAVEFSDPLGKGSGRLHLHRHYERVFRHVSNMRYDFGPVTTEGGRVSAQWIARFRHAKLNRGREISLRGATWLEFGGAEDKVIRFDEYFDLGELAYEKLPLLGFIIRRVKGILKGL